MKIENKELREAVLKAISKSTERFSFNERYFENRWDEIVKPVLEQQIEQAEQKSREEPKTKSKTAGKEWNGYTVTDLRSERTLTCISCEAMKKTCEEQVARRDNAIHWLLKQCEKADDDWYGRSYEEFKRRAFNCVANRELNVKKTKGGKEDE